MSKLPLPKDTSSPIPLPPGLTRDHAGAIREGAARDWTGAPRPPEQPTSRVVPKLGDGGGWMGQLGRLAFAKHAEETEATSGN